MALPVTVQPSLWSRIGRNRPTATIVRRQKVNRSLVRRPRSSIRSARRTTRCKLFSRARVRVWSRLDMVPLTILGV